MNQCNKQCKQLFFVTMVLISIASITVELNSMHRVSSLFNASLRKTYMEFIKKPAIDTKLKKRALFFSLALGSGYYVYKTDERENTPHIPEGYAVISITHDASNSRTYVLEKPKPGKLYLTKRDLIKEEKVFRSNKNIILDIYVDDNSKRQYNKYSGVGGHTSFKYIDSEKTEKDEIIEEDFVEGNVRNRMEDGGLIIDLERNQIDGKSVIA